ncbi:hypothetical protein EVA_19303 [gut metagenome]|uniref:Uncharacterized protein n=1 Tax=gut metagenome TaxID=749906 RepID=J9FDV9_9ZZZZ
MFVVSKINQKNADFQVFFFRIQPVWLVKRFKWSKMMYSPGIIF